MALSDDGTLVYDTTLLDNGVLTSAGELGYPFSSADAVDAPSPRTDFVPVLSRRVGGVFVVGGRRRTRGSARSSFSDAKGRRVPTSRHGVLVV